MRSFGLVANQWSPHPGLRERRLSFAGNVHEQGRHCEPSRIFANSGKYLVTIMGAAWPSRALSKDEIGGPFS